MRIIQGSKKGKFLKTGRTLKVRPTLSKVRKSIFDVLMGEIIERKVLDLFAGFGTLGIEAISMGATEAVFVDNSKESLRIIRDNLSLCGFTDRAALISGTLPAALDRIKGSFDVVFMDAPYDKNLTEPTIYRLVSGDLVNEGSIVVVQTGKREKLNLSYGRISLYREKNWGDTNVYFYRANYGEVS